MKKLWYNPDTTFLGVTGCDSILEMAELVKADTGNGAIELVFGEEVDDPSIEDVVARLNTLQVEALVIASSRARQETWDDAWTSPCAIDDKPGRGYVKVLGLNV